MVDDSQNVGFQAVIGKQTFLKSELNSMLMYVRLCIQCLIEPRSNQVIQKENKCTVDDRAW